MREEEGGNEIGTIYRISVDGRRVRISADEDIEREVTYTIHEGIKTRRTLGKL